MNLLQLTIDMLSLGSQYALVSLGIGLVFGVMRMINFAHGDLITLGAYALIVPSAADFASPYIGAFPAVALVVCISLIVAFAALAGERFAFRPLRHRGADSTSLLISSFAVSYLIQSMILFVYTGRPKSVSIFLDLTRQIHFVGATIALVDVATICVTVVLLVAVASFLRFGQTGIELRAASENFMMARLLGVKADRVISVAFAISGVLAASVSLLYLAKTGVLDFRLGLPLAIAGFVGTVVGGTGSLIGAILGGLFLGAASTLLQALLPEEVRPARDAFLYGLVILVLLWRPSGLFGGRSVGERI